MKDKKSLIASAEGLFSLSEIHNYPTWKDPEPKGCQTLKLAQSAENGGNTTIMSELVVSKGQKMGQILDDPDQLLKNIMTDQLLEYQALSGGIMMAIYCAQRRNLIPEELIPIKLKVDSHLLKIAHLNKQLSSPSGQIKITGPGAQINVGLAQQINGSLPTSGSSKDVPFVAVVEDKPKESRFADDLF